MNYKTSSKFVEKIRGFSILPRVIKERIASFSKLKRYEKGDAILRLSEEDKDLFFIVTGKVRISLVASTGRSLTFQILDEGEMFGEVTAIDGQSRTADVIAESDAVIGRISNHHVKELIHNPEFAWALLERMARLNRRLTQKVFEYHTYDVRGRVYLELLELARVHENQPFEITDRDMASRVGTTRENVSRIHADLRRIELIKRDKSKTSFIDVDKLQQKLEECEFQ